MTLTSREQKIIIASLLMWKRDGATKLAERLMREWGFEFDAQGVAK
jgi:hypothetical protein